ncbi:hypothetical protein MKW92_036002 [Papaver armeniacum]|nr:hypothetical protein MKW92_036002 [Papaver armeniacum]
MGNPNTNTNYRKKTTPSSGGGAEEDLHREARTGDIHAVQSFIASNPLTVNSRDKHSRTRYPFSPFIFCKNKADVRADGLDDMGAIHFAAQKGHFGSSCSALCCSKETDSKPSTEEKPLGSPGNNQNFQEENFEKDPNPSTEVNSLQTLEPVVEDVIMQDERQDNETSNEKRKGNEVEMKGKLSGPKKAKIALNHHKKRVLEENILSVPRGKLNRVLKLKSSFQISHLSPLTKY